MPLLPQDSMQQPCLAEKLPQRRSESLEKPLGISKNTMPKNTKKNREWLLGTNAFVPSRNLQSCCCNRCVSMIMAVRRFIWLWQNLFKTHPFKCFFHLQLYSPHFLSTTFGQWFIDKLTLPTAIPLPALLSLSGAYLSRVQEQGQQCGETEGKIKSIRCFPTKAKHLRF